MVMFKAHTKAAGMIVAAALLAALCTAFSHPAAYASEVESPFTKTQDFAREIKEYVGDVADEAAAQAEAEALEGRRQSVGFDCSGFTRWVFSHALGRELPRTAAEQSALGVGVSLDELVPGDLLFWGSGSGVYHVGIYAGDGEYIHASTGGGRVMRATFDYFAPDFAKRIIE